MNEIWKDIRGYEGFYQVSNLGRVKTLSRKVLRENQTKPFFTKERITSGTDHGNGYKYVSLTHPRKNYYVHRLVAETFIPNPDNKKCVNHKDFDRANNNVENLEWCTHKENSEYSSDNLSRSKLSNSIMKNKKVGVRYKQSYGVYEAYLGKKYLGTRKTYEEARKLRTNAEMEFLRERGFYESIYK